MFRVVFSTFFLLITLPAYASSELGTVHFGFENGDLEGWEVVAGEFSQPVCQYGRMPAAISQIRRRSVLSHHQRRGHGPDRP